MTNREWLNTLSNEQLVKVMRTFQQDACSCCVYPIYNKDWNGSPEGEYGECGSCFNGQVAWMDKEHNDNDWDERDFWHCT